MCPRSFKYGWPTVFYRPRARGRRKKFIRLRIFTLHTPFSHAYYKYVMQTQTDVLFLFVVACQLVAPAHYYLVTRAVDRYDEQWAFRMFSPDGMSGAEIRWIVDNGKVLDVSARGVSDKWAYVITKRTTAKWILRRAADRFCELYPEARSIAFTRIIAPFDAGGGETLIVDPQVMVVCT